MMMANGEIDADWLRTRSFYARTLLPTPMSLIKPHLFGILDP